ncbi:MAG: peptidase M48 family protein [Alphaproteobacteria bacterium]|nr:MAG: peptidase M48 family protein [Alphaproteobacteria bacterium]
MSKRFFYIFIVFLSMQAVTGCSTNPATGDNQFTALMSPQQEVQVGAQEHAKILKQFGVYKDKELQNYVSNVGKKVVQYTERPEVDYKFFLLDSPVVNAFALPGGYIYMTRGLLALANSEAEMASVLAHETGHITGRHSAERYSRSVVTSLGAMILSSAVGSAGVSEALGVGSNLYLSSYSRGQESQADSLGIRYLSRSGYTPTGMSAFLTNLQAETALQAKIDDKSSSNATNYFSTHPATAERVSKTISEARQYAQQGIVKHAPYLRMLDGMAYGDSAAQGFVRGNSFYHPELGFKFSVPEGYKLKNQPSHIMASAKNGATIIFDFANNKEHATPASFIKHTWMKDQAVSSAQNITINGMAAATASIKGSLNGKAMNVRLIAIRWSDKQFARFQIAVPSNLSAPQMKALKASTYSFNRMSKSDKSRLKPYRIKLITSKAGDSVASVASRMAQKDHKEQRFRVLNGLKPHDKIVANRLYKIVTN